MARRIIRKEGNDKGTVIRAPTEASDTLITALRAKIRPKPKEAAHKIAKIEPLIAHHPNGISSWLHPIMMKIS